MKRAKIKIVNMSTDPLGPRFRLANLGVNGQHVLQLFLFAQLAVHQQSKHGEVGELGVDGGDLIIKVGGFQEMGILNCLNGQLECRCCWKTAVPTLQRADRLKIKIKQPEDVSEQVQLVLRNFG